MVCYQPKYRLEMIKISLKFIISDIPYILFCIAYVRTSGYNSYEET